MALVDHCLPLSLALSVNLKNERSGEWMSEWMSIYAGSMVYKPTELYGIDQV